MDELTKLKLMLFLPVLVVAVALTIVMLNQQYIRNDCISRHPDRIYINAEDAGNNYVGCASEPLVEGQNSDSVGWCVRDVTPGFNWTCYN